MKKLFYWCLLLTVAAVARPARAQQFSIAWKYAQKAGMKKDEYLSEALDGASLLQIDVDVWRVARVMEMVLTDDEIYSILTWEPSYLYWQNFCSDPKKWNWAVYYGPVTQGYNYLTSYNGRQVRSYDAGRIESGSQKTKPSKVWEPQITMLWNMGVTLVAGQGSGHFWYNAGYVSSSLGWLEGRLDQLRVYFGYREPLAGRSFAAVFNVTPGNAPAFAIDLPVREKTLDVYRSGRTYDMLPRSLPLSTAAGLHSAQAANKDLQYFLWTKFTPFGGLNRGVLPAGALGNVGSGFRYGNVENVDTDIMLGPLVKTYQGLAVQSAGEVDPDSVRAGNGNAQQALNILSSPNILLKPGVGGGVVADVAPSVQVALANREQNDSRMQVNADHTDVVTYGAVIGARAMGRANNASVSATPGGRGGSGRNNGGAYINVTDASGRSLGDKYLLNDPRVDWLLSVREHDPMQSSDAFPIYFKPFRMLADVSAADAVDPGVNSVAVGTAVQEKMGVVPMGQLGYADLVNDTALRLPSGYCPYFIAAQGAGDGVSATEQRSTVQPPDAWQFYAPGSFYIGDGGVWNSFSNVADVLIEESGNGVTFVGAPRYSAADQANLESLFRPDAILGRAFSKLRYGNVEFVTMDLCMFQNCLNLPSTGTAIPASFSIGYSSTRGVPLMVHSATTFGDPLPFPDPGNVRSPRKRVTRPFNLTIIAQGTIVVRGPVGSRVGWSRVVASEDDALFDTTPMEWQLSVNVDAASVYNANNGGRWVVVGGVPAFVAYGTVVWPYNVLNNGKNSAGKATFSGELNTGGGETILRGIAPACAIFAKKSSSHKNCIVSGDPKKTTIAPVELEDTGTSNPRLSLVSDDFVVVPRNYGGYW